MNKSGERSAQSGKSAQGTLSEHLSTIFVCKRSARSSFAQLTLAPSTRNLVSQNPDTSRQYKTCLLQSGSAPHLFSRPPRSLRLYAEPLDFSKAPASRTESPCSVQRTLRRLDARRFAADIFAPGIPLHRPIDRDTPTRAARAFPCSRFTVTVKQKFTLKPIAPNRAASPQNTVYKATADYFAHLQAKGAAPTKVSRRNS